MAQYNKSRSRTSKPYLPQSHTAASAGPATNPAGQAGSPFVGHQQVAAALTQVRLEATRGNSQQPVGRRQNGVLKGNIWTSQSNHNYFGNIPANFGGNFGTMNNE